MTNTLKKECQKYIKKEVRLDYVVNHHFNHYKPEKEKCIKYEYTRPVVYYKMASGHKVLPFKETAQPCKFNFVVSIDYEQDLFE